MAYKRISPQPVVEGGTGAQSFTAYAVLTGGTTTTNPIQNTVGAGTAGQLLVSGGAAALPVWTAASSASSITITGNSGGALTSSSFTFTGGTTGLTFSGAGTTETLTGTLVVANGGTGRATLTAHDLIIGNGTTAVTLLAPSATSGIPLISQGAASDPAYGTAVVAGGGTGNTTFTAYSLIAAGTTATGAFQNVVGTGTTGQLLVATTGALPVWTNAGSASSITITGDSGGALSGQAFTFTGGTTGLTFAGSVATETLGGTLAIANGGTNATSLSVTDGTIYFDGTRLITTATGTVGQFLRSGGAGVAPAYATLPASSISITGDTGGALTGAAFTFAGGTTGLSFGGSGTTETLTFAGITANGGTVSLATDATASTINIGTGGGVKTVTLGSNNTTSSTTINSGGTGSIQINSGGGSIAVTSSTGNLSISDDAAATQVKVATGAGAKTATFGSLNTTSTTTINSGTTGITIATGTTGPIAINPGTTGAVTLGTTSTGNVSVGNTTGTTSIQFGTGSALSTYNAWTTWTPTLVGGTVAGATTYVAQNGYYTRIGDTVVAQFRISISAATGTGSIVLGGLPFTISNNTFYQPSGSCKIGGAAYTWPAGSTMAAIEGALNSTLMSIVGSGSASAPTVFQMQNTALIVTGTLVYRV